MLGGLLWRRAHENWGDLCGDNMCIGTTCHREVMNIGATCQKGELSRDELK